MNKTFEDYEIIEKLNKDKNGQYYLLKCKVCGHIKRCSYKNLLHQNNNHSKHNCKYDYYKKYIGTYFGDYKIEDIYSDKKLGYVASARCKFCNNEFKGSISVLNNKKHNPSTCGENYYKNYIGKEFGDYIVINFYKKNNLIIFLCECKKCHRIIEVKEKKLNDKLSHKKECIKVIPNDIIKLTISNRFGDMYQRCNNKNNTNYKHYGSRGIKLLYDTPVDLYDDFYEEFKSLLEEGKNIRDYTFDRIDVNGNYEKNNLRLATQTIQSTNTTRKGIFIIQKGKERIISDSYMECGRFLNCSGRAIGNLVRGNSKTSYGWTLYKKYKNNIDIEETIIKESVTTNLIVS